MTVQQWVKLTLALLGLTALASVVSAWLVLHSQSPMSRCEDRRFTSARWKDTSAAFSPKAVRGCLVDDLLRSHELRGRTRQEIVGLLGEPPKTDYFREYDLAYWLGPERSYISIDSEWLVMRLDAAGRVSEFRLVTD